ncbi:MAG TPA: 2-amino-3,7-dideoxy-D-threo-hept-6-ulosonate synthase [Thermodesulfobacteriota bacterium]|nr:2-amino-3,7-dideoxy-D-threo-hept-6-ulosonate synthase [Deltaproteobacteria bacterium]HNR14243.1 2-amino-3,7-dideoxy-D-threo-hept-6-ulosonate synthase [Thermodesulfobacteriota bacterium]HOC39490.1 2-amino-3,7-dideoxy-D-threo-hept-6-ulosonate synthase [Thermodesulfobacteriota bacterium]HQO78161.1 2-amino-3,7-dideoxy-D-threo-hept-6-ulosonate synthase [Thermodesulfobacteriota bacterium]
MMGKSIRIERILDRNTRRTVIVPMDHGVSVGPIKGLIAMGKTVDLVAEGGANAVIGHVGLALYGHRRSGKDVGLILHLSASTSLAPDPNYKVLINTVQHALKMGADAVSVHINVGADDEARMLQDLGRVAVECMEWGLPLLAMMYPRGAKIDDENEVAVVKHAARVGAELGADIIKCPYTGSPETFRQVVEGCPVPVVIAGGSKHSDEETFKMIEGALQAGAAGISMGRNAFQHDNPSLFVQAACAMVHQNASVQEALELIRKGVKKT